MVVKLIKEYIDLSGRHPNWNKVSHELLGILEKNNYNRIVSAYDVKKTRKGKLIKQRVPIDSGPATSLIKIQSLLAAWESLINPTKVSDLSRKTHIDDRNGLVYSRDDLETEDPVVFVNRSESRYLEIRLG